MSELVCPECANKLKLMYSGWENYSILVEIYHCEKCLRDWQRSRTEDKVFFSELERKFWG